MNQPSTNNIQNTDSYRVINNGFFTNNQEPFISLYNSRCAFNACCISSLNTDYIHMLVSEEEQKLIIIPSEEHEPESIRWTSDKGNKRPKQLKCPIFFGLLVDMMSWDSTNKYRITGHLKQTANEKILVFDLKRPEIYMRLTSEYNRHTYTGLPYYTQDWHNRFGIAYSNMPQQIRIKQHAEYTVIESPERS